jgi:hypothetical protein
MFNRHDGVGGKVMSAEKPAFQRFKSFIGYSDRALKASNERRIVRFPARLTFPSKRHLSIPSRMDHPST